MCQSYKTDNFSWHHSAESQNKKDICDRVIQTFFSADIPLEKLKYCLSLIFSLGHSLKCKLVARYSKYASETTWKLNVFFNTIGLSCFYQRMQQQFLWKFHFNNFNVEKSSSKIFRKIPHLQGFLICISFMNELLLLWNLIWIIIIFMNSKFLIKYIMFLTENPLTNANKFGEKRRKGINVTRILTSTFISLQ